MKMKFSQFNKIKLIQFNITNDFNSKKVQRINITTFIIIVNKNTSNKFFYKKNHSNTDHLNLI